MTEHPCVLSGARHYFPEQASAHPGSSARGLSISTGWKQIFARAARGAVAVMAANNETGVIQPWREVLSLCRQAGGAALL